MKKHLKYALFLFLAIILTTCFNQAKKSTWQYTYELVLETISHDMHSVDHFQCLYWTNFNITNIAIRYADVVDKNTKKFEIKKGWLIANHIKKESRFKFWTVGDNGKSIGAMMIQPYWHAGKLYKCDNGKLGKRLKKIELSGHTVNHIKYLKRIGYNVEVGCRLWRQWLDNNNENYIIALVSYCHGPSHIRTRQVKKQPRIVWDEKREYFDYVRIIFGKT